MEGRTMTSESTDDTVRKLVDLLNRADARNQSLEQDLNEANDLAAELVDQKDVEADYIQRLETQVQALTDNLHGCALDLDKANEDLQNTHAHADNLSGRLIATESSLIAANKHIRELEGGITVEMVGKAWNSMHSLAHNPDYAEEWRKHLPPSDHERFISMVDNIGKRARINAIRDFRVLTGAGLKESKEWVEARE